MFIKREINKSVIPSFNAIERFPLDVSSTIPVVIVRVKYAIFPPTIIIAPTSDNAHQNPLGSVLSIYIEFPISMFSFS